MVGCDENSFSRGFELILPSNWAMPFWIALIYQGARAGGLQEAARVSFEAGALHFPDDFIDTDVGREINDQIADEKVKHYNRCVCYFGFLFTPSFDAADKTLTVRVKSEIIVVPLFAGVFIFLAHTFSFMSHQFINGD